MTDNPNIRKSDLLPRKLCDKENIDNFLNKNKGKKVVVVQGLGFVGSVMSLVCANARNEDYAVIGVDIASEESLWKINSINDGNFPITSSDAKVVEYFENSKKKENFYATYDPYAYSKADNIIVDINLDVVKEDSHLNEEENISYSVDLTNFKNAIKTIGENCKSDALVLIETTVPPGTTKIAHEILISSLKSRNLPLNQIKVGHSYERVMPGPNYIDSIENFYRVYSGIDEESAESIERFLKTIIRTDQYPLTRLKNTNATELSKVLENSFRAMNIAFIVEWSRFAEDASVDLYEVVDAIRKRPTHKNIMLPGIGVGGYCLTKDPLLASWSKQNLVSNSERLPMSEMAVVTNDRMPSYAFRFLKKEFGSSLRNKKVALLGVSYAPDVGDTRFSPVEPFYKLLQSEGALLEVHDPFVRFWDELKVDVYEEINFLQNKCDILVFTTGHSIYKNNNELFKILARKEGLFILDTIGVLDNDQIKKLYNKNIVKVIGRGDL